MTSQGKTPPFLRRPYMPFLDEAPKRQCSVPGCTCTSSEPLQQDLSLKPFYDDLTGGGLGYAYAKYNNVPNPRTYYRRPTSHPKHVIVVGAGMAGLSAAHELAQGGHQVTILELQHRVGGRAKTIKEPFDHTVHAEGGAMRLPPSHFLTKHYIDMLGVKTRKFQNANDNGFYYLYGDRVKMADWNKNPGWYCTKYWPGWDSRLQPATKAELQIDGIDAYFNRTIAPVIAELQQDHSEMGWARWVEKWSKMSVLQFLQSEIHQYPSDRYKLRPWPEAAIKAYRVKNYMPLIRASLVELLRDEIGEWWGEDLYTPVDGMESLAWAFTRQNDNGWNPKVHLARNIRYGIKVESIEEITSSNGEKRVRVKGHNSTSLERVLYEGDAVIITVPLTIMRQMDIPLSRERQQAVEGIYTEASTKILIQSRTRFWQKPDNLQGGFSKTNLPVGQIHYPDYEESGISPEERGILVVYTWAQEAETFGAQSPKEAIANAVKDISKIHPELPHEFEVGAVQAWFNDPSAQGAFVFLRPNEYNNSLRKLIHSEHPVYLAGEGLSWSNGWIQGAMESGLRAAYEFYCHNELQYPPQRDVSISQSECAFKGLALECEMAHSKSVKQSFENEQWPFGTRNIHHA